MPARHSFTPAEWQLLDLVTSELPQYQWARPYFLALDEERLCSTPRWRTALRAFLAILRKIGRTG